MSSQIFRYSVHYAASNAFSLKLWQNDNVLNIEVDRTISNHSSAPDNPILPHGAHREKRVLQTNLD
jgi:hypothetical protein